jgi:5-methyltetrahydrofolate--homocysteine methyltransferase
MDDFVFYESMNFVNIGERCNLAGSALFKKMIKNNEWDKAAEVAKK